MNLSACAHQTLLASSLDPIPLDAFSMKSWSACLRIAGRSMSGWPYIGTLSIRVPPLETHPATRLERRMIAENIPDFMDNLLFIAKS
jgi:hypothetical protein